MSIGGAVLNLDATPAIWAAPYLKPYADSLRLGCAMTALITAPLTFWNKPSVGGVNLIRKRGKCAGAVLNFSGESGTLRALWAPRGR